MTPDDPGFEHRVLVQAPTARDAELAKTVFDRAGIASSVCPDMATACAELDRGAGVLLVAEESILQDDGDRLGRWLAQQPAWSDLPVLILAQHRVESETVARAMDLLGNVTVLERPIRVATLVSAVRTAMRARSRQYQIREHLAERARTEDLLRANDRRKDEFLAILAHELRNPLAPIRTSLDLLRLNGSGDETIDRVGEVMERQVDHLVRLVDDLLEVSRISRGKIELRRERVELASVLRTALETSRPLIEKARHALETTIPAEPLPLDADPVRLAQVFSNILNNAAKYTDPGGTICVTAKREGGQVAVSVRDDGAGIPPEMLSNVFELFTQVENGAGRSRGGLGIGLTLVRRLAEMHGGTVEARSDGLGKGSEFVVKLPLAAAAASDLQPESANGSAARGAKAGSRDAHRLPRHRVLVVDDNVDAADSVGMLLRTLGAETRVVYGGAEALDALEAFRPAVVLLDIGMPGMDGHEVARRIRARGDGRGLTLIALTGWGQKEDVERTRQAGFDYHLIKPLDLETLEKLLRSVDAPAKSTGG